MEHINLTCEWSRNSIAAEDIINDDLNVINLNCINGIYNLMIKDMNGVIIKKIEVLK